MKIIAIANLGKFTFVNVDSCKLSLSKVKLNDKRKCIDSLTNIKNEALNKCKSLLLPKVSE